MKLTAGEESPGAAASKEEWAASGALTRAIKLMDKVAADKTRAASDDNHF